MRFELVGSLIRPDPLILEFEADDTFEPLNAIDLGYTHFEVICIGGGGGAGGGINTNDTGTLIRSLGGAGGGGGFQRVRGLLSVLPDNCPIVVGAAGSSGTDHVSNPALTTDGGDGEASTFNTNTCRASGGKGGKRVQTNSTTQSTLADGGEGGAGNRIIAGGGAAGGVAGTPSDTGPGVAGSDGQDGIIVNEAVGRGGGGGAGGVGKYSGGMVSITCNPATAGGRGSYNPGYTIVYGPGEEPTPYILSDGALIVPGSAGGAKASPLNGLPIMYGRSGESGIVIVRLTAEVLAAPVVIPGANTLNGAISRTFTFSRNVNGIKEITLPRSTPVSEISLASHGTPSARTDHSIKIRARTTSGSGAVIKAALYEGSTNRSGDLTSDTLTNSLADYSLPISVDAASAITSYSNLSIRIWGYVPDGSELVFEVAEVYLELPSA